DAGVRTRALAQYERQSGEVGSRATGGRHGEVGHEEAGDARHATLRSGTGLPHHEGLPPPPEPAPGDRERGLDALQENEPSRSAAPAYPASTQLESHGGEGAGGTPSRADQQRRSGALRRPPQAGPRPPVGSSRNRIGVEQDEPEAARAEEDLRGPERVRHSPRPDPEQARERDARRRKGRRVERVLRVDPRDRLPGPRGARGDRRGEARPPGAPGARELRDPSAGKPAAGHQVQRRQAGRQPRNGPRVSRAEPHVSRPAEAVEEGGGAGHGHGFAFSSPSCQPPARGSLALLDPAPITLPPSPSGDPTAAPPLSLFACGVVVALVLVVSAPLFYFIYSRLPVLYDADGYYHLAVARAYAERGILHTLDWARFSVMHDGFGDKEFLLHVLLIPFARLGDPTTGAFMALAGFSAVVAALLAGAGLRAIGAWGVVLPLLVFAGATDFS